MSFFYNSGGAGFTKPIDTVQNCYSDLGLDDSVVTAGSEYNRSLLEELNLEDDWSDFYGESVSDVIPFTSVTVGVKLAPVSVTTSLGLVQGLILSGGRMQTGTTFFVDYDSGESDPAPIGLWVRVDSSSGEGILATSAGTLSEAEVAGVIISTATPGEMFEVKTDGRLSLEDWTPVIGSASLTPGLTYYLTTGGQMSSTAPTDGFIVTLGRAITAKEFQVEIRLPWGLT